MIRLLKAWLIIALAVLPLTVLAYVNPGKPTGFVNDFAGTLDTQARQALEAKLAAFKQSTGNEIAVVTIKSLEGDTIENYAVQLFKEWGIGEKGKDNGVLVLVAIEDREVRIEVGYGLEGALTDAQANWIIQNVMIPAFKQGSYASGIDNAIDKIIAATGGEVIPSETKSTKSSSVFIDWFWLLFFLPLWLASILARSKSWWAGGVVGGAIGAIIGLIKGFLYAGIFAVGVLVPLGLLFDYFVSRSYQRGKTTGRFPWWIGGRRFGGGGGFGGFGGGSSGGGGASGRW